jgi:hypothetical protein
MDLPRITGVKIEDKLTLFVSFSDGKIRHFDCNKIVNRNEYFQRLKDYNFFKNVSIDPGGYGLSWDDYVDLSEYEILENSY